MMRVLVAAHQSAFEHDTGFGHPERPERVAAVLGGIRASGLEVVEFEAPRIEKSELMVVHDPSYVESIETFCRSGGGALDIDTYTTERSWEAALRSAGAVRAMVEELETTSDATGFAVTRPPGHHATADHAMGFCLFNNVAVAAMGLRVRGQRVAILDWDAHHGNGTQALVGDDPGVLYVSMHQDPFYPYQGHVSDIDRMAAGTTVNIPLPPGTAGDVVRRAWAELVVPVLTQFEPDWVFLSAGYDAHVDDPLADLALTEEDFGWMAARLAEVHPANRVVMALEGGYDLRALERSVSATVRGVAGIEPDQGVAPTSPSSSKGALDRAALAIERHWRV
jgi:acetoin utilization deacetylase AcuC-like enzyme